MKRIILIFSLLFLISCADDKVIDGTKYRPYGLLNEETCKNDSIQYEISIGACVSGVLFCELIVPTIYTFGFNLFEPVGLKNTDPKKKGVVE